MILLKQNKNLINFIHLKNNEHGLIYPKSYLFINNNSNSDSSNNDNNIEHYLKILEYSNDNHYYSSDPLTSIEISKGGSIENIKNYYNFYLNKLTKVKSFVNSGKKFYNNRRYIDIFDTISSAKDIVEQYILHNSMNSIIENGRTLDQKNNGAYIFNISSHMNDRIIIFGDIHGSYHTFLRLFVRLHLYGAIDFVNYKINDGYKIIFLGDITDRGQYSLEIIYIISKFIINNNSVDNLKIILNRGNHEDHHLWSVEKYGFLREIDSKIPKKVINSHVSEQSDINLLLKEKIMELLYNCSSAIIINYKNKKYWLSHGGFPIGTNDLYNFQIPRNKITFYGGLDTHSVDSFIPQQIRWSDFHDDNNNNYTGENNKGRPQIGIIKLQNFIISNKINFIIRGHTDNTKNAFLLRKINSHKKLFDCILDINNKNIYDINKNKRDIRDFYNRIIFPKKLYENKYLNTLIQTNGPIARLRTNNWLELRKYNSREKILDKLSNKKKNFCKQEVYPVLTISTNSDLQRSLNNDSFIVLNFSYHNDFNKISKKNRYNLFRAIDNNFINLYESLISEESESNENNSENISSTWKNVNNVNNV